MIVHDCKQYSPEWWDVRKGVPTASEFGRILTPKKLAMGAGAETYATELIGQRFDYDYGPKDDYQTAAMRNGSILEPEARRFFEFETGQKAKEVGFCTTDDKRFGCSPDSLVGDDGVLELKSPKAHTQIKYLLDNKLPDDYRAQTHGHLIVTGRKVCHFMSYYPGLPPLLIRVEPDEYTQKLAETLDEFWELYQNMLHQIIGQPDAVRDHAIAGANYISPF